MRTIAPAVAISTASVWRTLVCATQVLVERLAKSLVRVTVEASLVRREDAIVTRVGLARNVKHP